MLLVVMTSSAPFKPRPADPVIRSVGLSPLIEIELQVLIHIRRGRRRGGLAREVLYGTSHSLACLLHPMYAAMNLGMKKVYLLSKNLKLKLTMRQLICICQILIHGCPQIACPYRCQGFFLCDISGVSSNCLPE